MDRRMNREGSAFFILGTFAKGVEPVLGWGYLAASRSARFVRRCNVLPLLFGATNSTVFAPTSRGPGC